MNWITNFVKPTLKVFSRKKDIPENLWIKCDACDNMIFHRLFYENMHVCNHCNHHMVMPIKRYFSYIFDNEEYQEIDIPAVKIDPLKFKDSKKYIDRLKTYRNKTKKQDAVLMGYGNIDTQPVVMFAMDFSFMGGSMGAAVGESFVQAVLKAVELKVPFIALTQSGGARMQEAAVSLMQMPKTVAAIELLKESKLPYWVILTSPTFGGVTASFAMLGDIHIAEPGALIGFTGRRVIEQTIRQKLPESFQTAEYQLDHGMIDTIVPRAELKDTLKKIINIVCKKQKTK